MRAISSVGRAPALQAGGHWFEPGIAHSISVTKFYLKTSYTQLFEYKQGLSSNGLGQKPSKFLM